MRTCFQLLAVYLFLSGVVSAAPKQVFLSESRTIVEEPLVFWASQRVELEILSHCQLPEPEVFVLSKALTAPLRLQEHSYQSSELEQGLHVHQLSFLAPEPRAQQRYILRFEEPKINLLFDVYPTWLREQVARKSQAYAIRIEPKHARANTFFAAFELGDAAEKKRPQLKVVHSEYELVLRESPEKVIWKTNCDELDIEDPAQVLSFEALLDTLKTLNKK